MKTKSQPCKILVKTLDRDKIHQAGSHPRRELVGLFAAFLIFAGFKAYPRAEDVPDQAWLSELFEKEYGFVPNSEDTRAALVMIETGNYAQALESLRSAGSSGDSSASVVLAELYLGSDIVEQDNVMARMIFLRGARQGNLKALAGFARLFWGEGREKLLELAAEAGDRSVYNMRLLGLYYMQGSVVKCDYLKSAYYYRIAAEEGSAEGAWQTAGFLFRGYMIEQDLDGAVYWANRAKQLAGPQNLYHQQANILLGRIRRTRERITHVTRLCASRTGTSQTQIGEGVTAVLLGKTFD